MESEIQRMKKEMEDFQIEDEIEEQKLEKELNVMQKRLRGLNETRQVTGQRISKLKSEKANQTCTYQEKKKLLRQIEELKDENRVKREKIEHMQEIKNKFDRQLAGDMNKIKTMAIRWNRSLMESCIKRPELNKLLLREKAFHDLEFLQELRNALQYKIQIENEVEENLKRLENEPRLKHEKKFELEREVERLSRAVSSVNLKCVKIRDSIAEFRKKTADIMSDIEELNESHAEQLEELQACAELKKLNENYVKLKKERDDLDLEVKKFGQKIICFFVELHNQVIDNIRVMDKIQKGIEAKTEERLRDVIEKQKQALEFLNSLNIDESNEQ